MNEVKKKRLSILKKQNRLNQILPNILNRLIEIEPNLGQAKILQIVEIEELLMRIKGNNHETTIIKRASQSNPKTIYEIFEKISDKINQKNYFSTNQLLELWYAEVNTKFIIKNFEKVIEIDGDLLIIHDKELNNGLWLDLNEEYWTSENTTNYEWVYEMKVWGKDWTDLIFK